MFFITLEGFSQRIGNAFYSNAVFSVVGAWMACGCSVFLSSSTGTLIYRWHLRVLASWSKLNKPCFASVGAFTAFKL